MKILRQFGLIVSTFIVLAFNNPPKSIYSIPVKDIDGNQVDLKTYRGKKIMVLIISGQDKDSALLNRLVLFCQRYKDSISVIAVPSIEDGYSVGNKAIAKRLIVERGLKALILEGAYTRKAAGNNQAELMQWLTNKSQNMRTDLDVMGTCHRFFIDDMGGLVYAVVPPIPYTAPFIEKFMSWPVIPVPVIPGKENGKKN